VRRPWIDADDRSSVTAAAESQIATTGNCEVRGSMAVGYIDMAI
jgi:hypothetical protein